MINMGRGGQHLCSGRLSEMTSGLCLRFPESNPGGVLLSSTLQPAASVTCRRNCPEPQEEALTPKPRDPQ